MSKPGRNDPCPCGSGKKYKQCCLKREQAPARNTDGNPRPASAGSVRLVMENAMAFHRAGNLAMAEQGYREVLRQTPRNADALHFLGLVAYQGKRYAEALELISAAIKVRNTEAGLYSNLGLVHEALHHFDAAVTCYRKALALDPNSAEANCNLGGILANRMALDEAIVLSRKALASRPDLAEAWCNLGLAHHYQARLDSAIDCFHKALNIRPDCAQAWHNLGNSLKGQGRQDEAIDSLDRALALKPDSAGAYGSLFFSMLYHAGGRPADLLAAHRRYAAQFEAPLKHGWPRHANRRDPDRPLKIGYVSPDFRFHSVAFFMEPILEHHDRGKFVIHAYYNHARNDEVTARIRACTDQWTVCNNLSDSELAERIRADGIDILIDLAGHSANNRLLTFARKPAPVQVTWLGYPATTGLSAIDWRLTTLDVDPEGSDAHYSERLWRLPRTLWCYRPAAAPESELESELALPETGDARRAGPLCFGSMNTFSKVSPESIDLWCRILHEAPGSRLVMTQVPDGSARQTLLERFSARGIGAERVRLHGRLQPSEYRALTQEIDIALDPFPYTGTTTTCESLWLGIPVVTLVGDTSVSRSGYALLKMVGLEALCARNEEDYVHIAVGLARDADRRAALRAGMRARIAASPLRDETGFTRELEHAYRAMWRAWCAAPVEG